LLFHIRLVPLRLGTRVVPVYVLSLAGLPPGVLLDGESLVAAAADLVGLYKLNPAYP
jgi:hypothetical protein